MDARAHAPLSQGTMACQPRWSDLITAIWYVLPLVLMGIAGADVDSHHHGERGTMRQLG